MYLSFHCNSPPSLVIRNNVNVQWPAVFGREELLLSSLFLRFFKPSEGFGELQEGLEVLFLLQKA